MDAKDLVVIIPMNRLGSENLELLKKAVESVPNELKIIISCPKAMASADALNLGDNVEYVYESDGDSFVELVNAAVNVIDAKWFSILEFDDTYTKIWYDNVKKYIEFMPSTSVFMFLEDITDFNNGSYIGFGNQEAWASSFSNDIGYLDNDCLQNYFDFYLTGSIFNLSDWKEIGGMKPHIKLTFWYEWLLRATHNGKKVYVIPKVGYNHTLGRKDSLVEQYKKEISEEETQFLFDLAKREYFYRDERDLEKYIFKKDN